MILDSWLWQLQVGKRDCTVIQTNEQVQNQIRQVESLSYSNLAHSKHYEHETDMHLPPLYTASTRRYLAPAKRSARVAAKVRNSENETASMRHAESIVEKSWMVRVVAILMTVLT